MIDLSINSEISPVPEPVSSISFDEFILNDSERLLTVYGLEIFHMFLQQNQISF